jgi:uncharacterized protein (DUF488 family)
VEIYTIGFTQSTAERFFGRLNDAGVKLLLDVRLNNQSQLAGFAKRQDLPFFLRELCGASYAHEPMLAPDRALLDAYKKRRDMPWGEYEHRFLELMRQREVERRLDPASFAVPTALLCSEATPERCHRRLVIDYLARHWADVRAVHL